MNRKDEIRETQRKVTLPDLHPDGSTDNLLAGLSTLTPQDLEDIKSILADRRSGDKDDKSPRTEQYLDIARSLYMRALDPYISSSSSQISRNQLYGIYDEMDDSVAYVTSALDILSDDATQPDEYGNIYYIDSPSEKVRNLLTNLFEDLEIESKISKWARAIAKYGDLFVRVYGSTEDGHRGVSSVDDTIYPSSVERRDYRGKLVAFIDMDTSYFNEDSIRPPWDYIHFRHKGDLTPLKSRDLGSQETSSLVSSYGQSILRAAVKVYTQLKFVENMILLSRLTNSVRRNIFSINVGEVDPKQAFETIKKYSDLLKKDVNLNLTDDLYNSAKHTAAFDEDIFIPVSDPKNDIQITTVGGDVNIAEQYDLEYLLNKLFAALKIPKAYLNYEQDLNARSTLIQLDIRYARSVSQLQTTLITGLTRLANIHLAYLGLDPDAVDFTITMTSVSAIDQEARLEQKQNSVGVARDMWDVFTAMNDTLTTIQDTEMPADLPAELPTGSTAPSDTDLPADLPADSTASSDQSSGTPGISDIKQSLVQSEEGSPEESARRLGKRIREDLEITPTNSPMNMKYLAGRILKDYMDFTEDEVSIILNQKTESMNDSKSQKRSKRISGDTEMDYPTLSGRTLYEGTRDMIIESMKSHHTEEPDDIDDAGD